PWQRTPPTVRERVHKDSRVAKKERRPPSAPPKAEPVREDLPGLSEVTHCGPSPRHRTDRNRTGRKERKPRGEGVG
ncbi:hypothetical protein B8W95_13720, partial [Staphylococcus pasteuri]